VEKLSRPQNHVAAGARLGYIEQTRAPASSYTWYGEVRAVVGTVSNWDCLDCPILIGHCIDGNRNCPGVDFLIDRGGFDPNDSCVAFLPIELLLDT